MESNLSTDVPFTRQNALSNLEEPVNPISETSLPKDVSNLPAKDDLIYNTFMDIQPQIIDKPKEQIQETEIQKIKRNRLKEAHDLLITKGTELKEHSGKFIKKYGDEFINDDVGDFRFEVGVLLSKFVIIFTLLILSYTNADNYFVSKHPKAFLSESMFVGATAAVSTILLGLSRGNNLIQLLNGIFIAFLLFFVFNVLMEFSGMNNYDTRNIYTDDSEIEKKLDDTIFSKYGLGFVAISTAIMIGLASHVKEKDKTGVIVKDTNLSRGRLALETLLFGFINASPVLAIASNRGADFNETMVPFGKGFLMYSGLYVLLEKGGFWNNIFGKKNHTE